MSDTVVLILFIVAVIAAAVFGYLTAELRVNKKRDAEDNEFYSHLDPFLNAVDAWNTASVSTEDERLAADRTFKAAIDEWNKYDVGEEEEQADTLVSPVDGAN